MAMPLAAAWIAFQKIFGPEEFSLATLRVAIQNQSLAGWAQATKTTMPMAVAWVDF